MAEDDIWSGTSSQMKNLGVFARWFLLLIAAGCVWQLGPFRDVPAARYAFLGLAALAAVRLLWGWLAVKTRTFRLTTERLLTTRGILSTTTETMELYRVRDLETKQPLWLRLFGLQNVRLVTADTSNPILMLDYIPASLGLGDKIRTQVEACRMRKRVREVDVDGPVAMDGTPDDGHAA